LTLYVVDVTVPPNTASGRPVQAEVQVEEDIITRVSCFFPPGCVGMVHTSVWIGHIQVIPRPYPQTLHGDAETITWDEFLPLPESPCKLTIKAWSPGTSYPHTITWRIVALPRSVAAWWYVVGQLVNILAKLFRVRIEL
jgi:hypothetical protein